MAAAIAVEDMIADQRDFVAWWDAGPGAANADQPPPR
jgi:hypothetical protein